MKSNPEYDEKFDIWQFGYMIYTCIAGAPPFEGTDNDTLLEDINAKSDTLCSSWTKKMCHQSGIDMIKACLSINPADRPSAAEIVKNKWIRDQRTKVELEDDIVKEFI